MKKRHLVFLVITFSAVCALAFNAFYREAKNTAIKKLNDEQVVHARQAALGIEDFFRTWTVTLNSFSKMDEIINTDADGKRYIKLFYEAHHGEIRSITRMDDRGTIIYTVPFSRSIGSNISEQKHVNEILNKHKPVISDVFKTVQGFYAVALHVPVFKGSVFKGTIAIVVNFESLAKRYLDVIKIGETGYAWVISRDGTQLYSATTGFAGKSVFENYKDYPSVIAMVNDMLKGHEGIAEYTFDRIGDRAVGQIKKYAVYMPIQLGNTFWSIVVTSAEQDVLSGLISFKNRLILILGVIFLFGIVFSLLGAKAWLIVKEEEKRKQAEETLRKSEALLKETQQVSQVGGWEYDIEKKKLTWTDEVYRIYGVSHDDYDPNDITQDIAFYEDAEAIENAFRRAVEFGEPYDLELKFRNAGGKSLWVRTIGKAEQKDGKTVRVFGNIMDITERKRAEEELRITNEELLAIQRIIITTTTGVKEILEKVMDEALSITGFEGGTICMVTPDKTLHLAAHRETSEATILDLTTNEIKVGECLCGESARDHKPLILRNRDEVLKFATREATRGEDIRFHAAFPLVIGERCLGVLCVFTRTDKKPAERRLKLLETVTAQIAIAVDNAQMFEKISRHAAILEDEVEERTKDIQASQKALQNLVEDLNLKKEDLKQANVKLKDLDSLKSMFIASMSHELRTPLNSIIGFTGIILQGMTGDINEEQRDQLQRVSKAGKHLLSLITDVIDISKIEAGKIEAYAEEFELEGVLNDAVSDLKLQIKEKGLELEVNMVPEKITMNTDRKRLFQCVLNYLSNAVKFTEKGKITVFAEEKGDIIQLKVTDTGIGIKEKDIPMLFQSFVRLDSTLKMTVAGTGLGLYLTRKLVTEVLNGEVSVASTYGKGSTFMIRIPVKI
jgi:PAS domain S-box-containing protein